MNSAATKMEFSPPPLSKIDPASPVLKVIGRDSVLVKAGTNFRRDHFPEDLPVLMPHGGLEIGADYGVMLGGDRIPQAVKIVGVIPDICFGGFHFAPGGNAAARAGGDEIPAINPRSIWDLKFRPACPDVRGQALTELFGLKFWSDIYMLGVDHRINGTSKFGVTIADGNNPPVNPVTGKKFNSLDYDTAVAVMSHHGKSLMSYDEFKAFAFGVTEKTSASKNPKITGLDAPRTSHVGGQQASGNKWAWGHDGDPDKPRASIFGGSCLRGSYAGSRYAFVDYWPDYSGGPLGARGRSDHLQLA
jgi:hypothetical protein